MENEERMYALIKHMNGESNAATLHQRILNLLLLFGYYRVLFAENGIRCHRQKSCQWENYTAAAVNPHTHTKQTAILC